jgi:hypothetical protein
MSTEFYFFPNSRRSHSPYIPSTCWCRIEKSAKQLLHGSITFLGNSSFESIPKSFIRSKLCNSVEFGVARYLNRNVL